MTQTNLLIRNVEAVLFAGSKRMTVEDFSKILPNEKAQDIQKALEQLKSQYDSIDVSICIITDGTTWKFSLKDQYLKIAESIMSSNELPRAVLGTLAMIAWKSPILQADMVKLRSVSVYEHIAELEKIGLVARIRKGRSFVLKVTEKFYDYFDIPQEKAREILGKYEEISDEKPQMFNKGDTFSEDEKSREARLIQEIRQNKIDPEALVREDKDFLDSFDKRLLAIEKPTSEVNPEVAAALEEFKKENPDAKLQSDEDLASAPKNDEDSQAVEKEDENK